MLIPGLSLSGKLVAVLLGLLAVRAVPPLAPFAAPKPRALTARLVTVAPLTDAAQSVNSAMVLLLVAVRMTKFCAVKPVFPRVLPAAPKPQVHSVPLGPSVLAPLSAMVLREMALGRDLDLDLDLVLGLGLGLVTVQLLPRLLLGLYEALLHPALVPSTAPAYGSVSWLLLLLCYK